MVFPPDSHQEGLKIEDSFDLLEGKIQQGADAAGEALQEPDVGDRRSEFDMPHPFSADFGLDYFHTTFFTDGAAVLHAFVFPAVALVIFYGTKYLCAEKTIPFRLERPIINCFRLFYFAMRP